MHQHGDGGVGGDERGLTYMIRDFLEDLEGCCARLESLVGHVPDVVVEGAVAFFGVDQPLGHPAGDRPVLLPRPLRQLQGGELGHVFHDSVLPHGRGHVRAQGHEVNGGQGQLGHAVSVPPAFLLGLAAVQGHQRGAHGQGPDPQGDALVNYRRLFEDHQFFPSKFISGALGSS